MRPNPVLWQEWLFMAAFIVCVAVSTLTGWLG